MVLIIAHRGFSGRYPENTLLSIRKAIEAGADWVEIDARLSLDQKVVIIHDTHLKRTTTGKGRVATKTLAEIQKYRVKGSNEHIPSLEEVFSLTKNSNVKLNIEVKGFIPAKKVIDLIKKHNMQEKVIVSSGSLATLTFSKMELPSLKTAWCFYASATADKKKDFIINLLAKVSFRITSIIVVKLAEFAHADYLDICYPFATKRFIKKLKSKGYGALVWTVNTPKLMRKMIGNGADGITTDHPNRLKRVLAEKSRKKKKLLRKISLKKINVLRRLRRRKHE